MDMLTDIDIDAMLSMESKMMKILNRFVDLLLD